MNNTTWILAAIVCALLLLAVLKTRAEEAAKSSSLRWRFASPKDPASSAYRSEKLRRIDAWWKAFESKKEDIALLFEKRKKFDLPKWIRENLQVIDERMVWEFGPGAKGGNRPSTSFQSQFS